MFDIDKDALRFAERDKNHLGVFRMESKCFYPRVYVWLKISYQCFQIYLPVALGYRNNEIDTIEGKK